MAIIFKYKNLKYVYANQAMFIQIHIKIIVNNVILIMLVQEIHN